VDRLRKLRVKAEDPVQEGKAWTFYYNPLTQEEAEAEKKKKEKDLGKKYDVKVELSDSAKTYYLKVSLKCPDAMPVKSGFEIWEKCFPSESKANELRRKFDKGNVEAQVYKLDEDVYGLYYKPLKTEADAKAAGKAANSKRPGAAEGMYEVKSLKDEALKSYTYSVTTTCPTGYKSKGNFLCTSYFLAQEAEFAAKPALKDPCGLKGTFRESFLFGSGVKMQGSGKSLGGDIIQYNPKADKSDCFKKVDCPKTAAGTCATSGQTVAVDPKVIPLGSKLLIEDVGPRIAEDTGGRIKGQHIDVYHGTDLTMAQAMNNTLKDKKVCQKT
jgi:3D (Asp-Asp-Asp) domain-containing protein